MKNYRVWLTNKMAEDFPLFERITEKELTDWLDEWAECATSAWGDTWWVDGYDAKNYLGLPYDSMGYIVKYEEI